jgi:predicted nucleotidyltransferase
MTRIVEDNINHVRDLCKKHQVQNLYLIGSAVSDSFSKSSDIDFVVIFSDNLPLLDYADNYFDLKFSLEKLFERKVDLIEEKAIRNPFFLSEVNNTKVPIYG